MTAGEVASDTVVTVTATHTIGGVNRTATHSVLIVNSATSPTFTSLDITGPTSINEQTTALYSATATFSDGSTQIVVPTWSENSAATSISIFGLLSAGDVSTNTNVTVSATATIGGVTRSASRNATILAQNVPPTITSSGAASGIVGQPFQYLIAVQNGPATISATGLPPGLSFNGATSTVEGTPATAGVYSVSLTATTGAGTANGTVIMTISDAVSALPYEFKWANSIGTAMGSPVGEAPSDGALVFNGFTGTRLDSQGQVVWTVAYGNNNPDVEFSDCKRHPAGGWAVSGYFKNTAVFGSDTLVSAGSRDPFLMRIDDSGDVLWARRCGGTKVDYGEAVAVDGAGNCFLAGVFTTSATFGGSITLNATGTRFDIFVAKYSSSGDFLWVQQAGGPNYDDLYCAVADASGNVYIGGIFDIQATFGGQTLTVQGNQAAWDGFLAKFGPSGGLVWVKQFGEPAGESSTDPINAIRIDAGGNCYFAGGYDGPLTLEGQTIPKQSGFTGMVGKISTSGTLSWLRAVPATGPFNIVQAYALAPMGDGGCAVGGSYYGKMTFGSSVLTPENESGSTEENLYIAKFDSSGLPSWAIPITGTGWKNFRYLGSGSDSKLVFAGVFEGTSLQLPGLPPLPNNAGGSVLGVLGPQVVPVAVTYAQWLGANFNAQELADPLISGPNADIDGDGIRTLLEFATGRNPRVAADSGNVTSVSSVVLGNQEYLTVSFVRRTDAVGITYHVDESSNLGSWVELNISSFTVGTPVTVAPGLELIEVRSSVDMNADNAQPGCFLRLRVTQP